MVVIERARREQRENHDRSDAGPRVSEAVDPALSMPGPAYEVGEYRENACRRDE
jgi:hypothetical protein